MVFNIVYTPGSVRYLRVFVWSLLRWSDASFRLIANGCTPSERDELREYCKGQPRLEYVEAPSSDMQRHGAVLNWLQSLTSSRYFCVIDSDIFATGPALQCCASRMADAAAVFSGLPVWVCNGQETPPQFFRGLSGEYLNDAGGQCIGVTYVALYDNQIVQSVRTRERIGFEARDWNDVPAHLHGLLATQKMTGKHFDTGKLLNLMIRSSFRIEYAEEPALCHIGGASFEIAYRGQMKHRSPAQRLDRRGMRRVAMLGRLLGGVSAQYGRLSLAEAAVLTRRRLRQRNPVRSHLLDVLDATSEFRPPPPAPDLGIAELDSRIRTAHDAIETLFREYRNVSL